MPTIPKTLKNSGGDFTTLQDIGTWIVTNMKAGGPNFGDTLLVRAKGGQTFVTDGNTGLYIDADDYSGTLIIETDPNDYAVESLATILDTEGYPPIDIYSDNNNFNVTVRNLKIGCSPIIISGSYLNGTFILENNVIVHSAAQAMATLNCDNYTIVNNIIVSLNPTKNNILKRQGLGTSVLAVISNNTFVAYNESALVTFKLWTDASLTTLIATNNLYKTFGGGTAILSNGGTIGSVTMTGNIEADPLTVDQLVQAGDTNALVLARNFKTVVGSSCINGADPTYAPATDIYGTTRS